MRPTRSLLLNLSLFQKASVPAAGIPQRDPAALSQGIAIVREVLKRNPSRKGWKTSEIYALALKRKPEETFKSSVNVDGLPVLPPHLDHPVRSKSFLKEILAHMQGYKDIKMVRHVRQREGGSSQASFVWKQVDKSLLPQPKVPKPRKPSLGVPLGLHEDVGHLNKRRQRARKEKLVREITQIRAARRAAHEARVAQRKKGAEEPVVAAPASS